MKNLKSLQVALWAAGCLFATACSSTNSNKVEKGSSARETPQMKTGRVTRGTTESLEAEIEPIDYDALKRTVGMNRPKQELGYVERPFEGCGRQFGLADGSCQRRLLVSVQYRLLCRDSEGTVSQVITAADLQVIPNKQLSWNLKGVQGQSYTDFDGYGEVLTVSTTSQRNQRLKLSNGNDFLYLRAGEVDRLVTPASWCKN